MNLPKLDSSLDIYWHSVGKMEDLRGKLMFENVSRFVKTCLVLSVGNAQPERGFSENKLLLDGRLNLGEATIEAIRLIKHEINLHNLPTTLLPITKELLVYFNNSFKRFKESQQADKDLQEKTLAQKKEDVVNKRKQDEKQIIGKNLSDLRSQLRLAQNMCSEGQALMNVATDGTVNQDLLFRAKALLNSGLDKSKDLELQIAAEDKKLNAISK